MTKDNIYNWEKELEDVTLKDKRLKQRLVKIMEDFSASPGKSVFLASGSRSAAKAVYRFLANDNIQLSEIMEGIRKGTSNKIREAGERVILCIQDTTSISFGNREKIQGMGYYCQSEQKGMNVHSAIAVTPDGLPLGLLHQEYRTRETPSDQTLSKEEKKARPIEEKESYQWLSTIEGASKGIPEGVDRIHVCDREGDFYELFDMAEKNGETFLVRILQDRQTLDGRKIITDLKQQDPQGTLAVHIARDTKKNIPARIVLMNYAYGEYEIICPRRRKEDHLAKSIKISGIYVWESGVPKEKRIQWLLMTNSKLADNESAVKMIEYYAQRWKIERFHYVLKSGCGIEKKQARSYESLCLLTLLNSEIAMRILNLTYIGRLFPNAPCNILLEEDEWRVLYCISNKTKQYPEKPYTLQKAIRYIAKLGGFVGAPSDGEPGVKVMWIGLEKLLYILDCRAFLQ